MEIENSSNLVSRPVMKLSEVGSTGSAPLCENYEWLSCWRTPQPHYCSTRPRSADISVDECRHANYTSSDRCLVSASECVAIKERERGGISQQLHMFDI